MMDELRPRLLKEPLIDILHRQMEAADIKEIADRVFIRNQLNGRQTEITLRFIDEDLRRMDRQEFRRHVSERLNAAGDVLMRLWEDSQR